MKQAPSLFCRMIRFFGLAVAGFFISGCDSVSSGPPVSTEWLSSASYQAEVQQMIANHYYPVSVEGRANGSTEEYRATFVPYPSGSFRFYCHHGLTKSAFQTRDAQLTSEGLNRTSFQSFVDSRGTERFQGVWTNGGGAYSPPVSSSSDFAYNTSSSSGLTTGNDAGSNSPASPSLEGVAKQFNESWNTTITGTWSAPQEIEFNPITKQAMIPITVNYQKPNDKAFYRMTFMLEGGDARSAVSGRVQMVVGQGDPMSGSKTVEMWAGANPGTHNAKITVSGATLSNAWSGYGEEQKIRLIVP